MTRTLLTALLLTSGAHAEDGPDLAKAVQLPIAADDLRHHGVPDADVIGALKAARAEALTAAQAAEALATADEAVRAHGPIDGFGAYVQAQLAAGKRGPDLAAAIRAEHEARGQGPHGDPAAKEGHPKGGGGPAEQAGGPDQPRERAAGKGGKAKAGGGR